MPGFNVVGNIPESDCIWVPIDRTTGTSLYVGQLVKSQGTGINGSAPLAVASGAFDASNLQIIQGVVIGDNNFTPTFIATYGQYIATVQTQAQQLARNWLGVEGMTFIKGDPQAFVKIARIGPNTLLRGPIFNATYGVAPTVCTATAVNATAGLGFTGNAVDVTPVANMCTSYCRTGLNTGLYRVNKDAHATVHTYDTYWPYTPAIGDTFVILPYKIGISAAQINSTAGYIGMCFDCSQTPATNYFGIDVVALDFKVSGRETVDFRFCASHFTGR